MQVYLGRWHETDVAIKVIAHLQNLSPLHGLRPQDPSTMQAPGKPSAGIPKNDQVLSNQVQGTAYCIHGLNHQCAAARYPALCVGSCTSLQNESHWYAKMLVKLHSHLGQRT